MSRAQHAKSAGSSQCGGFLDDSPAQADDDAGPAAAAAAYLHLARAGAASADGRSAKQATRLAEKTAQAGTYV